MREWGVSLSDVRTPARFIDDIGGGGNYDLHVYDMGAGKGALFVKRAMMACESSSAPLLLLHGRRQREERNEKVFDMPFPLKPARLFRTLVEMLDMGGFDDAPEEGLKSEGPPGDEVSLSILLAEDNEFNRILALKLVEKSGFSADTASNGLDVLAALERKDYDLVFMDVLMPEMDGMEATRFIRRDFPERRQPYIVAMTAQSMQGDREKCIDAGMDDYISKPVRPQEVLRALRTCAARKAGVIRRKS